MAGEVIEMRLKGFSLKRFVSVGLLLWLAVGFVGNRLLQKRKKDIRKLKTTHYAKLNKAYLTPDRGAFSYSAHTQEKNSNSNYVEICDQCFAYAEGMLVGINNTRAPYFPSASRREIEFS